MDIPDIERQGIHNLEQLIKISSQMRMRLLFFRLLALESEIDHVLFEDESMIRDFL